MRYISVSMITVGRIKVVVDFDARKASVYWSSRMTVEYELVIIKILEFNLYLSSLIFVLTVVKIESLKI